MVNLGFLPHEKPIPSPDMSFVRMFDDASIGWQYRGQYAIWMGASSEERSWYTLLERVGLKVAPIRYTDGSSVFHTISANTAFIVSNLMGFWIAFDSDAMWLDTPSADGQYAVLTIGGSLGKPGRAVVDWMCPKCGNAINPKSFDILPHALSDFLNQANDWADGFNKDKALRTCVDCGTVHPVVPGMEQSSVKPIDSQSEGD